MKIKTGEFYAMDHENIDGVIETNILYVLGVRENTAIEVAKQFYVTETMFLIDGQFDSIYKNDWLGEFFERKATPQEIDLFHQQKKQNPELKQWAELVTGVWIS
ncbi:hypothetical protein [Paenibacillus polymyxa]|uniref:hypothetical protein n=1 Tax=Paenibacillus polymyxa TaxID=1406 RepID=UPI0025B64162|nr:hypothetical protein [Paenibacillus polymyxa]MDN4090935.1 hypothetical protein [Paenibacillus polymyxa]